MKKLAAILPIIFILMSCEKEMGPDLEIILGSFTDQRDGRTYQTVNIACQEWMAENLSYLPFVNKPEYGSDLDQCCYVYGFDSNIIDEAKENEYFLQFGVLYNWPAVALSRHFFRY